jgi:hypothetical protein
VFYDLHDVIASQTSITIWITELTFYQWFKDFRKNDLKKYLLI